MTSGLRVVFMGTPDFAVPTLAALLASAHTVVGVVTQPDRPRGRGQQVTVSPVKALAEASGLPVLQPETLRVPEFIEPFTALAADIGVVAAYGKILSERVLAIPRLGMINVHASLLPRHRGAAPIHRAILAGDAVTGITIMRVVKALDAGAMLATVSRPIGGDETSADLETDLAALGAALLVDTLDRLALGLVHEEPQDDALSTYASRLTREDGVVDWSRSAADLHNQIRGLHPWPHAVAYVHGRRLILRRSTIVDRVPAAGAPGEIIRADGQDLHVATGAGTLALLEVQPEGKRPMSARDYLAGQRLTPGERFTALP